jgi:opacity protein-like surface antigen
MTRTMVPALVTALALGSAAAASAQDKPSGLYLRGDAGASFTTEGNRSFGSVDQGDGYAIGGGVGYRFSPSVRSDFTLGYRGDYGFDQSGGGLRAHADLDSLVGLLNGYWDIGTVAGFTPYVGGGIGFADNSYGRTHVSAGGTPIGSLTGNSTTELAWQATAGMSYSLTHTVALDLGYHHLDMGTAETGSTLKGDLQAHEVQVGLRYSF